MKLYGELKAGNTPVEKEAVAAAVGDIPDEIAEVMGLGHLDLR